MHVHGKTTIFSEYWHWLSLFFVLIWTLVVLFPLRCSFSLHRLILHNIALNRKLKLGINLYLLLRLEYLKWSKNVHIFHTENVTSESLCRDHWPKFKDPIELSSLRYWFHLFNITSTSRFLLAKNEGLIRQSCCGYGKLEHLSGYSTASRVSSCQSSCIVPSVYPYKLTQLLPTCSSYSRTVWYETSTWLRNLRVSNEMQCGKMSNISHSQCLLYIWYSYKSVVKSVCSRKLLKSVIHLKWC